MITLIVISALIQAVLYLLADRTRVPFLKLILLLLIMPANILYLMPEFVLAQPADGSTSIGPVDQAARCGLPALGMLFVGSFLVVFVHLSFHVVYSLAQLTWKRFRTASNGS